MKLTSTTTLLSAVFSQTLIGESLAETFPSYAPVHVKCPSDVQWIRSAVGLGPEETKWVHSRKKVVLNALAEYLERLQIEDFDVSKYVRHMYQSNYEDVPTMGLAISGGGYASAYTGTAALRALDSRLEAAVEQRTGGLLQCMTYMTGLSGGSFPTVSFAVNNFPTADEIVDIWKPEINRFTATNDSQYAATFPTVFKDIGAKYAAGFNVSTSDFFALTWGYEFAGPNGGLNTTWSSVTNLSSFTSHQMPFPIVQGLVLPDSDQELFGLKIPYANDTIIDITPFEFGGWGGSVAAFTPTKWLGTRIKNGSVLNGSCVQGFDRSPFMIGISGSAYNLWTIEADSNSTEGSFSKRSKKATGTNLRRREEIVPPAELSTIDGIFQKSFNLSIPEIVYADVPNPFAGLISSSADVQKASTLNLVDGSESGQTIPFWSLIQPAREPSFIIGWDDSQDAPPYSWNNGTNLYNTYLQAEASGIPFPIIPPPSTIINLNYTYKPVFFGCNSNLTTTKNTEAPIVLYFANAPYSAYMNFSAGQSETSRAEMNDIFVNGFNQVTQGNGTLDSEWPVCLGCAAIERSLEKVGMETPSQCKKCFERYCWDGTYDNSTTGIVDLSPVLNPTLSYREWLIQNPDWNATLAQFGSIFT